MSTDTPAEREPDFTSPGIHHVSAISGDPQETLDFYVDVLGLRLVKRTVNFDDKFMYHFYFGNETGDPGTLYTLFPFQRGQEGRTGHPQPKTTGFTIPEGSAEYWCDRLAERGVEVEAPEERFEETVVTFHDQDGQELELVTGESNVDPAVRGDVAREHAIRGIHGVTLLSTGIFHTAATLEVLGYELIEQEGDRVRYRTAAGDLASVVDLLDVDATYGREGIGTIHHVAFRAGEPSVSAWHDRLADAGLDPTHVRNRRYFESLYVREPGGILFEVSSDGPGVTVDEDVADLGSSLELPDQYEEDREMIVGQLPEVEPPGR